MTDNWFRDLFINEVKGATRGQNTKSDIGTGGSDTPANYNSVDPFSASYVAHKPCYEGKEELFWEMGTVKDNTDYAVSINDTSDLGIMLFLVMMHAEYVVEIDPAVVLHYKIGDVYEVVPIYGPDELYSPEYESNQYSSESYNIYLVNTILNETLGIKQILLASFETTSIKTSTVYAPLNTVSGKEEEYGICFTSGTDTVVTLGNKFIDTQNLELPSTVMMSTDYISDGVIKESVISDKLLRLFVEIPSSYDSDLDDFCTKTCIYESNGELTHHIPVAVPSHVIPKKVISLHKDALNGLNIGTQISISRNSPSKAKVKAYDATSAKITLEDVGAYYFEQYVTTNYTFIYYNSKAEDDCQALQVDEVGVDEENNPYIKLSGALDITPVVGSTVYIANRPRIFVRDKIAEYASGRGIFTDWYELPLTPVESES